MRVLSTELQERIASVLSDPLAIVCWLAICMLLWAASRRGGDQR